MEDDGEWFRFETVPQESDSSSDSA